MVSRAAAKSLAKVSWFALGKWASGWARWASECASGELCSLSARWACAHFSSSCLVICQRFRLSRNASNSFASMARMTVRRLTFANWAAWAGDRCAGVGVPSEHTVGRMGTAEEGGQVSSCRLRSHPVGSVRPPVHGCLRCPGTRPRASR